MFKFQFQHLMKLKYTKHQVAQSPSYQDLEAHPFLHRFGPKHNISTLRTLQGHRIRYLQLVHNKSSSVTPMSLRLIYQPANFSKYSHHHLIPILNLFRIRLLLITFHYQGHLLPLPHHHFILRDFKDMHKL